MTKRKSDLVAKLGPDTPPPGWKQQIQTKKLTPDTVYVRKTYLLTPELIDRLKETADREHVGQNELLRYLLTWALDQLESGHHQLPLEVEQLHRIKF